MRTTGRLQRIAAGMTLFEVLLALAIFAIAAVSLVAAINEIGRAVIDSRMVRNVEQGIESILDEYSKAPLLDDMEKEIRPGKDGVRYRIIVKPLNNIRNQEGRILQGLFSIRVVATWEEGRQPMEMAAETFRYVGIFQPTG